MPYIYGLLSVDSNESADAHNAGLLGPQTLGIEVTNSRLASACGLGNIDPQHSGHRNSSAIEECMAIPLPTDGSTLVTIRPDMDSYGAMAVLTLRAQGKETEINRWLVSWIGAIDRTGLEQARKTYPELVTEKISSDAIQAVISVKDKRWPNVQEQIFWISQIFLGTVSRQDRLAMASQLFKNQPSTRSFPVEHFGRLAFILAPGKYREARDWGNINFPVTLVFDPNYLSQSGGKCPRWTLVRKSGFFDRERFETEINLLEAEARRLSIIELSVRGLTWGGNKNIVSSPQGEGNETVLDKEVIIRVVRKHFESGLFS